jgi:hypothetical protein
MSPIRVGVKATCPNAVHMLHYGIVLARPAGVVDGEQPYTIYTSESINPPCRIGLDVFEVYGVLWFMRNEVSPYGAPRG